MSTREIESWEFLEPYEPEPSEEEPETPEVPEPVEGPDTPDVPENEKKIVVNPADVPLEIVESKGDGVQMDLFGDDLG